MKKPLSDLLHELELAKQRVTQLEKQLLPVEDSKTQADNSADLRPLFNSSEDLIWFADLNNRIILANDATISLFKKNAGIDIRPGTAVTDLFPAEQVGFIEQAFKTVQRGKTLRMNYTGINQREYAAKIQPVREAGEVIGVSVFVHDITRTHQLQEQLRRYEQIVASSPNMIALIDHNHCFQMVNDSYLRAFNKQRQFLIGTHIRQLVGEEEYTQFTQPNLDRAFSGEHIQFDSWIDCASSGLRYVAISYLPLRSQDLQPKYVVFDACDITALKQAETDRQRIFDLSLDMLCIIDFNGHFIELNPAWSRTTGWTKNELLQKSWLELVTADDYENSAAVAQQLFYGESVSGFENRCLCKDGSIRWLAWSCYPDPVNQQIFATVRDITIRKQMEEKLLQLATTDPLTGAGNRRHFIERAGVELIRTKRYGLQMAVLMLDIDHFKEVNDKHGHSVGDEVLKRLVDCCHQELRGADIFGRFGGEEFAAVLVNTNKSAALTICRRLLQAISLLKVRTPGASVGITVSLGLTMHTADDTSIDSLLKRADNALYCAKNTGRNQIVFL